MSDSDVILSTDRLDLRRTSLGDVPLAAELLSDEGVMRFYPRTLRPAPEAWIERQLAHYDKFGLGFWTACLRESGEAIGQVGLLKQLIEGKWKTEIGYYLRSNFWNQGLATEAATGCRDYAFNQLNETQVSSMIRPSNIRSQRVAIKVGLRPSKLVAFHGLDHLHYTLDRPGS